MSIYNDFMNKLNESENVKKTYGDKPQEGKTEKLTKGKSASIPKGKGNIEKYKARKLEKTNAQAGDIYVSDTDKVIEKIDSTEHSDKGTAAKLGTRKSDKAIKYPFGDKPGKSDSKLIKESKEVKECAGKDCAKPELKEYNSTNWLKHQNAIENELEAAKEDMDAEAFLDFLDGVINLCQNYNGELDQFECAKSDK